MPSQGATANRPVTIISAAWCPESELSLLPQVLCQPMRTPLVHHRALHTTNISLLLADTSAFLDQRPEIVKCRTSNMLLLDVTPEVLQRIIDFYVTTFGVHNAARPRAVSSRTFARQPISQFKGKLARRLLSKNLSFFLERLPGMPHDGSTWCDRRTPVFH